MLVRIDSIPAGAVYREGGRPAWIALEAVSLEADGTYRLHVRHYPDGGDGFRRWRPSLGSAFLELDLPA